MSKLGTGGLLSRQSRHRDIGARQSARRYSMRRGRDHRSRRECARGRGERRLGRDRRRPAEQRRGSRCRRPAATGSARDSRGPRPGSRRSSANSRVGHREQPRAPALARAPARGSAPGSTDRRRRAASSTCPAAAGCIAAVASRSTRLSTEIRLRRLSTAANGSGRPLAGEPHQRPEIGADAGPVDQRRADDDQFDPGLGRRSAQRLLGGELGPAVGVLRAAARRRRGTVGPARSPRPSP